MKGSGRKIIVFGKVQGVFFRRFTVEKAKQLRLSGYVQNLESGEVKICAFGSADKLKTLEEWCKEGSPLARVDRVESMEIGWEYFSDFEIRY